MLIGAAIQTASFSAAQMLAGRVVTGLGMGVRTSKLLSAVPSNFYPDTWCDLSYVGS